MNKVIRIILIVIAGSLYVSIFGKISNKGEIIGLILLGSILIISMETTKRNRDKIFALQSEVKSIDDMSKDEFVRYMAELFKRLDYYVDPIRTQEDKGLDFIIRKGKQIICVRCETSTPENLYPLQAVYGSVNWCHGNQGMVVANGVFNEMCCSFAKHNKIKLIDRRHLLSMIQQTNKNATKNKQPLEAQGI